MSVMTAATMRLMRSALRAIPVFSLDLIFEMKSFIAWIANFGL